MARVALLICGLPRQWAPCYESQLRLADGHEADVFLHFWDTVDADEKRRILAAYRPAAHAFDPPVDFTPAEGLFPKRDAISAPSRMLSMYYGWRQVAALFDAYRRAAGIEYDYAVRLRSDLMFFAPLAGQFERLGPDDLLLSTHNDFGIMNDMFAVGGVEPVRYYLSLFDHVFAYRDQVVCNPERMLAHHLGRRPPAHRMTTAPIPMLVFRPHMAGRPIEECLREHPGASKWADPEIVAAHKEFHERHRVEGGSYVDGFSRNQSRLVGDQLPNSADAVPD